MGQRTAWLAPLRPKVVAVLNEIARKSPYGDGYGSATMLLARLARVAAAPGAPPRSIAAMRQAWWRWTSESSQQAALPPVEELAAIVSFADERGWLSELRDPAALALVERLRHVADERGAAERRQLERSLAPQVRAAVSDLVEHLLAELAAMPLDEAGTPAIYQPPAPVVQQFTRTVGESLIRQLLADLATPLDLLADTVDMSPHELRGETLMRPRSGWPRVLRELATSLSAQLEQRALEIEVEDREQDDVDDEAALAALRERIERGEVSPASATAKRAHLFSRGGARTQQKGGPRGETESDARGDSES